jgi:leader peptidase (prepilin peptidase)/N-methyltransferase
MDRTTPFVLQTGAEQLWLLPFIAISCGLIAAKALYSVVTCLCAPEYDPDASLIPHALGTLLTTGRCDHCGHTWGLVASLFPFARCGACRNPAFPGRRIMALGLPTIYLFAVMTLPLPLAIACSILASFLLALSVADFENGLLPDPLVYAGLWSGLAANAVFSSFCTPDEAIFGALAGYLLLGGQGMIYALIRGHDGIGGGDPKMAALIGAWVGAYPMIVAVGIGAVSALVYALICQRVRGEALAVRFGPFMSLGVGLLPLALAVLAPS